MAPRKCPASSTLSSWVTASDGGPRGFADSFNEQITTSISGEVTGTTGLLAITFGTAITIQNEITEFGLGGSGGSHFLECGTLTKGAEAWFSVDEEFIWTNGLTA